MKWYWACRLQAMGKSDLLALAQSAMEASKESGKHADWTAQPLVDLQAVPRWPSTSADELLASFVAYRRRRAREAT
jgi:hypothetical protein|eukprot:COSAG06_NODE_1949_length_8000_cov_2.326288_5_plen_76_part_00